MKFTLFFIKLLISHEILVVEYQIPIPRSILSPRLFTHVPLKKGEAIGGLLKVFLFINEDYDD